MTKKKELMLVKPNKQPRNPDGTFATNAGAAMEAVGGEIELNDSGKDWYHNQVYTATTKKKDRGEKQKQKQKQKPKGKSKGKTVVLIFKGKVSILGQTGSGKTRYGLTIPLDYSPIASELYGREAKITIDPLLEPEPSTRKELKPMTVRV